MPDEDSVAILAARFARLIRPPMVIYLAGDLGAGKTTFARAFIHALGEKRADHTCQDIAAPGRSHPWIASGQIA